MIGIYDSRIISGLRKALREDVDGRSAMLANGGLPDFAAYREQCGVIKGLRMALDVIDELVQRENGQERASNATDVDDT